MSRSTLQRTACILVAFFVLALPVAAQPKGEVRATLMERLLSVVWERLTAPLASLRAETTADPTGIPADPTDSSTPDDDDSEGRVHIDPNG